LIGLGCAILSGGCGDEDAPPPFEATLADCGDSLDVWLEYARSEPTASDSAPPVDATYSAALAEWPRDRLSCGLGAFSGTCADGKRLLYRNGGFTSEIRYFDGERLVGVVGSGDVGFCPSVCPFSHYYGSPDSVRCEVPTLDALCPDPALDAAEAELWMPFANGAPPGGCRD
jgi:hypothetical protein